MTTLYYVCYCTYDECVQLLHDYVILLNQHRRIQEHAGVYKIPGFFLAHAQIMETMEALLSAPAYLEPGDETMGWLEVVAKCRWQASL